MTFAAFSFLSLTTVIVATTARAEVVVVPHTYACETAMEAACGVDQRNSVSDVVVCGVW